MSCVVEIKVVKHTMMQGGKLTSHRIDLHGIHQPDGLFQQKHLNSENQERNPVLSRALDLHFVSQQTFISTHIHIHTSCVRYLILKYIMIYCSEINKGQGSTSMNKGYSHQREQKCSPLCLFLCTYNMKDQYSHLSHIFTWQEKKMFCSLAW